MAKYQILYWYDIPIQVKSRERKDRVSRELPPRFQAAIDNAAMAAGLTDSEAYMDGFQWHEPQEQDGTAQEVVEAVVTTLERQYTNIDWRKTVEKIKGGV